MVEGNVMLAVLVLVPPVLVLELVLVVVVMCSGGLWGIASGCYGHVGAVIVGAGYK